jgi:hypothetical protein
MGSLAPEAVAAHAHQHPTAVQLAAFQRELKIAALEGVLRRLVAFRRPIAAVPEHHRAAAIFALGDGAFEIAVVQRMIFDFHRETFVGRIDRGAARHRPGLEHAVPFQAQIVVQLPCRVLLHDEAQSRGGRYPMFAGGLGGFREIALGLIELKRGLRHHPP